MRKLGSLALAIPVLVAVYLATLLRRSPARRVAVVGVVAVVAGLLVLTAVPPAPSTAVPPSRPRVPVAADFASSIGVGHPLTSPVQIRFSAPMDPASVAGALRLGPDAPVRLSWNEAGTMLSLQPVDHWQPDTLYTVVVAVGARDLAGAPLAREIRTAFLTAEAGSGSIDATRMVGDRAALGTAFTINLDRHVDAAVVRRALRIEPAVAGSLDAEPGPDGSERLTFRPARRLAPDTEYRIRFDGLADVDGVPFADAPSLTVRTAVAPTVVRFRPRAGATEIARTAAVSVRFTEPMTHASTTAALRVAADGTDVRGTVRWAEKDTVLVFQPAAALPYGAKVTVSVDATAESKAGAFLAPASASFTVEPKPAPPKPAPRPAPKPTTKPITKPSGGGGAASGSWTAVESYYMKLMNCTRTGGLVTSSGSCSSPGGRNVAPLKLDAGISAKVSRPYAKVLATRNACDHFIGGTPGDRLRRAGYTSYRWAENIGCRSGDPYAAVLGSHLYFQAERNWSPVGGHYRNLMNSAYDRAGVGVWVYAGRVRLVVDFYHP